ncbi:MAG: FliA/WhiG family RNA polymerase sigma factor [Verrucomicrobia bacterium]|nr:FliA/WhiG family RNA polymerase sigma factor [Verrucomicrobiota bacterium]
MTTMLPTADPIPPAARLAARPRGGTTPYRGIVPGSAAEDELVQQHLPLVRTVVGRLAMNLPAHVDLDDLYSSGLVGLLNAVRNFDPNGGSMFESYARVRIRGAVLDELRRLDWVPRSVHDKARKVQAAMAELEQATGEVPEATAVARALKLSLSEYHDLLEQIRPATFVCLDAVTTGEDDANGSRHESIADDTQPDPLDCVARRELVSLIAGCIARLPEMQKKVLALYYYEDLRLREIAEAFGVTESRISQIHSQAILAIKSHLQRHEIVPAGNTASRIAT